MAEKSNKQPRKVEIHNVPETYDGRCQGTEKVDYNSSYVSFGGKLPEGEVLHKFEMRLPLPKEKMGKKRAAEITELYGYSESEWTDKALSKVMTDVDEGFKGMLFGRVVKGDDGYKVVPEKYELKDDELPIYAAVESPSEAGPSYDPDRHVTAQKELDEWRYVKRAAGKSVTVASFIQELVKTGRVDAKDLEGVETQADLFARLVELGINFG